MRAVYSYGLRRETWNNLFSIPPMPLHQGERPFGVYVRQAGHRVLLTFHPLAPFEVLDPLADLNHIGQTRECAVSSQLR